jgi:hypothetical protein
MSAMLEQMAQTLSVIGIQASESVVQVCQKYYLGSVERAAIYSGGIKGGLTAAQRLSIVGASTTETFNVTMKTIPDGESEAPPVLIKEGDRVTLRKDDADAGTVYTVILRQGDAIGATQVIILGPKHG